MLKKVCICLYIHAICIYVHIQILHYLHMYIHTQVVSKDTNVMLVALAGKAVADLAKGLKKNFYPYASVVRGAHVHMW